MTDTAYKILVVDDDPDLLKLLQIRLDAAGYETLCASNGEAAIAKLSMVRPHLVITDLRMPGMDGMGLFDQIRAAHPNLPVIILTAHGTIPDAVAATRQGIFSFLTKPFDSRNLLAEVEKAVRLSAAPKGAADAKWRKAIATQSPLMEDLLSKAYLVAAGDASVFIHGESGTGKELLARAIHAASPRRDQPFVAVNCGAIPEQLLESELFGHTKGSFTGATESRKGLFRTADRGTLFLDEIGDMPIALQVKLLRVLQEKQVRPVGAAESIATDARILSASHRDLKAEVAAGNFREDLFYRLNVVSLAIPSLAERREDIPLLANHFLQTLAARYNKPINSFSPEVMEMLVSSAWPGNVRQLLNVVEQAVALCTTSLIPVALIRDAIHREEAQLTSFDEARKRFEREYLVQLLKITGGNVTQAARLAKRNRTEFYKLLQRHQLDPTVFKTPST